jgi:hypothetical protein
MFKQILENKLIGDKLTNINNNAGKLAGHWIDKFRNSLDINENPSNSSPTTPKHRVNDRATNAQLSYSDTSLIESSINSEINYYHQKNNNNTSKQKTLSEYKSSSDDYNLNKTTNDFYDEKHKTTKASLILNETPVERTTTTTTDSPRCRVLVRQPTDLTCQFPSKAFQRINSETVEIPGLNVKVVRYRVEDDLGKIEPHMYIKYGNSNGVDSLNVASKGKLYFSLRYNEEIQSLSVTINKAEIYVHPYYNGSNLINNNNNKTNKFEYNDSVVSTANKPDTYVKVQLYPDKKRKYQTRIQRKTCTPAFEETFFFYIPFQDLATRSLNLTVFDFGRFTKHTLIGAVRLNELQSVKEIAIKDIDFVRNLLPLTEVCFYLLKSFMICIDSSLT